MSPRLWTSLAVRLYALWLLYAVVLDLPMAAVSFRGAFSEFAQPSDSQWAVVTLGLRLVLNVVVPILLLSRTSWFVDRAFGSILASYRVESDSERSDDDAEFEVEFVQFGRSELLALASALLGLVMLISVSSEVLTLAAWELWGDVSGGWFFVVVLPSGIPPSRLYVGVNTLLGVTLYLLGHDFARLWQDVNSLRIRLPRRYGLNVE